MAQAGGINKYIEYAYELLPPPLSSLPAKYHAPVSLLVHSLSAGIIASKLTEYLEIDESKDTVFFMGFVHDFAQKLISDGISTIKYTKKYISDKLDQLGFDKSEIKKILKTIELNTAETGIVPDGVDPAIAPILKVSDMMQGRLSLFELSVFIERELRKINNDIYTMVYAAYLPQVGARTLIMKKVIEELIDAIILVSPEGVLAISEDKPQPVHISWDDLRRPAGEFGLPSLREVEESEAKQSKEHLGIDASREELKHKRWSLFMKMFAYDVPAHEKTAPMLPEEIRGMLFNIVLNDVDYIGEEKRNSTCILCGMKHSQEHSFITTMYRKILGLEKGTVKNEKWNRFLPSSRLVRTNTQWRSGIGLCPLCALDAIALRMFKLTNIQNGFIIATISKPIPVEVFEFMGNMVYSLTGENTRKRPDIVDVAKLIKARILTAPVGKQRIYSCIMDYTSASVIIGIEKGSAAKLKSLIGRLRSLSLLISIGIYPIKFTPIIDTSVADRILVSPHMFPAYDYPVTKAKYEIPYTVAQLYLAGVKEEKEILNLAPDLAPLATAYLRPSLHAKISRLMKTVGGKPYA